MLRVLALNCELALWLLYTIWCIYAASHTGTEELNLCRSGKMIQCTF